MRIKILPSLSILILSLFHNTTFASATINHTLTTDLDQYVHSLPTQDDFSGVILIAENGTPVYEFASGYASQRYHIPINMQTKFNAASMGKMFTAIAILQLVEQGKIDLNKPIIHYLPNYANKKIAQQITVAQLLSHTSGLNDFFTSDYFNNSQEKRRDYQDYFPLFIKKPLIFKPGSQFKYSNAGFSVLGAIIEKVSGESYYQYINEHIFKPAGMHDTGYYDLDDERIDNLATGYTYAGTDGSYRRNNTFLIPIKGGPFGCLYTTAPDMLKFSTALTTHVLVGKDYTDMAFKAQVAMPDSTTMHYGYGFGINTLYNTPIIGHSGGLQGIADNFQMLLDKNYTVIILANYDTPQTFVLSEHADNIITDTPFPKTVTLSPSQMNALVGDYHMTANDVGITAITIREQNNTLQAMLQFVPPKGIPVPTWIKPVNIWRNITSTKDDTFYVGGDFNMLMTVKNGTMTIQNKFQPDMKIQGKKVNDA